MLLVKRMVAQELNCAIDEKEVMEAVKQLKWNKAVGVDEMQADLIKAGKVFLAEPLTALLNKVFQSGYPKCWTVGLITPIFKKGNPFDCGNYRGITVGVALGKVYAAVLNNRLSDWVEKHQWRAKAQAGFRKDFRCSDNLFILRTLKEKCANQRTKLYCCYVDFSKAFDTIPRDQLWVVLQNLGIYGNMLQAIKSIYKIVKARVKTSEGVTDPVDSEMGVLQGCKLSPLLFGLFLDPLEKLLLECNSDPPILLGQPLPAQFFADDSQLLSTTPEGLQTAIDTLQTFCEESGLTVNVSKTKIMIFGGKSDYTWTYDGNPIEVVESYKNLGLNVTPIGKFSNGCASKLTVSAKKAQHGLFSKCAMANISLPPTMFKLFDALVRPILCYGCEVWGVDYGVQVRQYLDPGAAVSAKSDEHEAVHKYFIKRVLGVSTSTPDLIIYGEVARLPLAFFRLKMIVNYWNRLCEMPLDRILKKAFLESLQLAKHERPSWCTSFRKMMEPLGYTFSEVPQCLDTNFLWSVREKFLEIYDSKLRNATAIRSLKLQTYNSIRSEDFVMPPYLRGKNRDIRKRYSQFRTGSHWLEIQQGRFKKPKTERRDRICDKCSMHAIEDEQHMVFDCPFYDECRRRHIGLFANLENKDLRTFCQAQSAARFVFDCHKLHLKFVADV